MMIVIFFGDEMSSMEKMGPWSSRMTSAWRAEGRGFNSPRAHYIILIKISLCEINATANQLEVQRKPGNCHNVIRRMWIISNSVYLFCPISPFCKQLFCNYHYPPRSDTGHLFRVYHDFWKFCGSRKAGKLKKPIPQAKRALPAIIQISFHPDCETLAYHIHGIYSAIFCFLFHRGTLSFKCLLIHYRRKCGGNSLPIGGKYNRAYLRKSAEIIIIVRSVMNHMI